MAKLTAADLRGVLELLYDLGSESSSEPFPMPVLDRLGSLLGAEKTGYGEFAFVDGGRSYVRRHRLTNRAEPASLAEEYQRWWHQDPLVCRVHARAVDPMAVSDRVSVRSFQRLEYFDHVHRPFRTVDSARLFLPAPRMTSRFFWFDRGRWGLKHRERALLELLRPHLVLWRSRWTAPATPPASELTAREDEILRAVADGATNREIADELWISPHTVRTHLQHIFQKLGVRTRTEAASLVRR